MSLSEGLINHYVNERNGIDSEILMNLETLIEDRMFGRKVQMALLSPVSLRLKNSLNSWYDTYIANFIHNAYFLCRRTCLSSRYAFLWCLKELGIIKDLRILLTEHLIKMEGLQNRLIVTFEFCHRHFAKKDEKITNWIVRMKNKM